MARFVTLFKYMTLEKFFEGEARGGHSLCSASCNSHRPQRRLFDLKNGFVRNSEFRTVLVFSKTRVKGSFVGFLFVLSVAYQFFRSQ